MYSHLIISLAQDTSIGMGLSVGYFHKTNHHMHLLSLPILHLVSHVTDMIPYRTKVFIGINVPEIRYYQNRNRYKECIPIGANCLKTTLKRSIVLVMLLSGQGCKPGNYWLQVRRSTKWTTQANCQNSLGWSQHWAREHWEKTTPSQIFMLSNLSSCRVIWR